MLAPSFDELALLLLASALGAVALLLGGLWLTIMNVLVPVVLMFTMARATIGMLRVSVATVWTPLLWLRAAIFFYGGFGTVVLIVANDASRDYAEMFFTVYAHDILEYNVILVLFTLVMLAVVRIVTARPDYTGERRGLFDLPKSSLDLSVIGLSFLLLGAAANFMFIIPYQFGYVRTTFPAFLSEVAQASMIGLFLTTVSLARRRSPLLLPVIMFGLLFVLLGLLAFSKSSTVMPWVMLCLAYFYLRPTLRRAVIMASSIVALFFLSAPLVDQGRMLMSVRYGGIDAPAPLSERLEMLGTYFDDRAMASGDEDVNYAALRFSYVNVGSFVVALRDTGQGGSTYENAAAIFVPRALWPDKPIITDDARQLSYQMTGNWNNSLAPGLAPEAYWNGGWLGVVLIAMLLGTVVSTWSIYNLSVQLNSAWHLFPIVLLGVRMGSRFDGFFVADVLGPIAFGVIGHFVLTLANAAVSRRRIDQAA
ncbi:hypothetical protein ACFO0A_02880 [Novosphingobium tardum]|uniref:Oligosaccharide repeat unit polymerase n=1 Tax=Novosphingobium tardum TaxID=1538021 RepID=A0ABV8RL09_9SPHN